MHYNNTSPFDMWPNGLNTSTLMAIENRLAYKMFLSFVTFARSSNNINNDFKSNLFCPLPSYFLFYTIPFLVIFILINFSFFIA